MNLKRRATRMKYFSKVIIILFINLSINNVFAAQAAAPAAPRLADPVAAGIRANQAPPQAAIIAAVTGEAAVAGFLDGQFAAHILRHFRTHATYEEGKSFFYPDSNIVRNLIGYIIQGLAAAGAGGIALNRLRFSKSRSGDLTGNLVVQYKFTQAEFNGLVPYIYRGKLGKAYNFDEEPQDTLRIQIIFDERRDPGKKFVTAFPCLE
jgi:hypothetical protein